VSPGLTPDSVDVRSIGVGRLVTMVYMSNQPTFHVPKDLADTLVAEGLAEVYVPPPKALGGGSMVCLSSVFAAALIFLDVAGDVVTLTGVKPPLQAMAARILTWGTSSSNEKGRSSKILAIGPKGQFSLDLDGRPDLAAVTAVLEQLYDDSTEG